jgi:predicted DNA-binding protein
VIHPDRRSHHTEEVDMSSEEATSETEDVKTGNGKVKSLYVQLKPEVHEQLTLLAKVKGNALAKEIREAIEAHVEASKSAPELAQQAQAALEEIEQEATARKAAIATLLGSSTNEPTTSGSRSRRKPKDEDSSAS